MQILKDLEDSGDRGETCPRLNQANAKGPQELYFVEVFCRRGEMSSRTQPSPVARRHQALDNIGLNFAVTPDTVLVVDLITVTETPITNKNSPGWRGRLT